MQPVFLELEVNAKLTQTQPFRHTGQTTVTADRRWSEIPARPGVARFVYADQMAAGALVSLDEYLKIVYRPDVDYVDGELIERNMGKSAAVRSKQAIRHLRLC